MKTVVVIVLMSLSGCAGWHRKPPAIAPAQLIVTGAPAGARLYIDGAPIGAAADADNETQVLRVTSGTHEVEVKVGDVVAYREQTFVAVGEKHVVKVLSGFTR